MFHVRLPPEYADQLSDAGKEEHRSATNKAEQIIKQYLDKKNDNDKNSNTSGQ